MASVLPEFKHYKESLELIEKISVGLKKELEKVEPLEFLPLWCLWVALCAEMKTLEMINGKYLNSPLAWDAETNLPSHPSLAADAKRACDFLPEINPRLKTILSSFSGRAFLGEETIKCQCASNSFEKRNVKESFYLLHGLKKNDGQLAVKQMLSVRADDRAHLEHHFSWSKPVPGLDMAIIVYESENCISAGLGGDISISKGEFNCADVIYDQKKGHDVFFNYLISAIRSFPA